MEYININGAYFQRTSGGLAAVNDQNILRGLKAGTIASTAQSSLGSAPLSNTVATPTLLPQAAQQQIAQGNYNLSPTPTNTSTPGIGGGLNTGSTSPTNLVSFKDTLASVMDLAQQKRNSNMQAFMGTPGFQGTVAASDFNTLFSQMNAQGDRKIKDVVDTAFGDTSKYKTETSEDASGNVTAVTFDPISGKIISKVDLGAIGTPSSTTGDKLTDAERKSQAIGGLNQLMQPGIKSADGTPYIVDGYLTPSGLKTLLAAAWQDGIDRKTFLEQYKGLLSPYAGDAYGLTMQEKIDLGIQ